MATRLVALASDGLRPAKIKAGKVINDPAADTALTKPPNRPATMIMRILNASTRMQV